LIRSSLSLVLPYSFPPFSRHPAQPVSDHPGTTRRGYGIEKKRREVEDRCAIEKGEGANK